MRLIAKVTSLGDAAAPALTILLRTTVAKREPGSWAYWTGGRVN